MGRGLFGRSAEVDSLRQLIDRSRARPGPTSSLVVGLAGSGKTRLLHHVLAAAPRGAVFQIVGYQPEQSVSLTATRDLFHRLESITTANWQADLLAFDPTGETYPLRLFEATHRALQSISPITLTIDDLQWVDDLSLALITYLLRAAQGDRVPLALVAMGRPGANVGALRASLAQILADKERRLEIELGPLTEADGTAMARALEPSLTASQAAHIWRSASGSPFWIEVLAASGQSVEADLSRRLRDLSDDAGSLLRALTVVGRPTDAGEIEELLGWLRERFWQAAGELRNRGLTLEFDGRLQVAHDLIRDAADRELPADHRREWHARIFRRFRQTGQGDFRRLAEALAHGMAAGEDVLDLAIELTETAQRRLLGIDGLNELGRISESIVHCGPKRQRLDKRLAELATELGDRQIEFERWLVVADGAADDPTQGRALLAAAKAAYHLGIRDTAAELVTRARRLGVADEAFGIALDALESEIYRWLEHQLPKARVLTTRAMSRARCLISADRSILRRDSAVRAAYLDALNAASDLSLQEGNEIEQVRFAEEIAAVAEGDLERMEARLVLASAYRRSGRVDEAERLARSVGDEAERRIYPAMMVAAGLHRAKALYNLGRLDEAEQVATEAEAMCHRIGDVGRLLSEIRGVRADIAVSQGDWQTGIAQLRHEASQEADPHYRLGRSQGIATWLARLAGAPAAEEVRARLGQAKSDALAAGCPRCRRELALKEAEAMARIGAVGAALEAISPELVKAARDSEEGEVQLRQTLGAMAAARGQSRRAAAIFARLSERLGRAGLKREMLLADLDLGSAWAELDRDTAVDIYRSVERRAADWGVATDRHIAQQRLRELGARPVPPRPQPGPWGLSKRELEVARLTATGASNPEIAAALFVARKTVERHVSSALAKTGARNRTELAAILSSLPTAGGLRK
ncbi:MAG TPA: AAA family ATPase [Acidimicrobiia bacterium]|nr:AAA family ATPase [Acidimicrobiia bacterium]